jgi:hypothetical protein
VDKNIIPQPIQQDELNWWVEYAKTMPSYKDALYIESALEYRVFASERSSARELMETIKTHFYVQVREKNRQEVQTEFESKHQLPILQVTDDQIAEAVVEIQDDLKNNRDYISIYRILVDCCEWPRKHTDFCKRFARLNFT